MKKIKVHSELFYILAIIILAFSVAMLTAVDFGISMIVAPAFLLSEKVSFLTFGQSEYVIQALLFIVLCILMKKVKLAYFSSFVTCLIYGAILDLWRVAVPMFNPSVTTPGAFAFPLRIVLFIIGMVMSSVAIAMFFHVYLYPQVYDFFVKAVSERFKINRSKFKICFDISLFVISIIMSLLLFKGFVGIGIGTVIMTALNGLIIGFFDKLIERYFTVIPALPKFARHFEIN